MNLADILDVNRVICGVQASSKKRVLELISETMAVNELSGRQSEIFDSLISRERLGSTGFGLGVAIPHGRVKSAQNTVGAFVHLEEPVDYDAIDGQPVDLIFSLVVPEESTDEHLQVLAKLAEMFSNEALCQQLRTTTERGKLFELLTSWQKDR
jgi:PTS system nitrogen regulatory IIA component